VSIRRLLKVPHIICAAIAIGVPCLAQAYDDDTHFVFTFLAARASGYSSIQASRIASACVEIDSELNENTEPKQLKRTLVDMLTGYGGKDAVTGYRIRRDFHAMLDQARFPESVIGSTLQVAGTKSELKFLESYNKARGAVRNQGQALENDLRNASIDNPGVFLHFLQDAYAHDGYGTYWGHYDLPSEIAPVNMLLPFGSCTDFLSFDPARDAAGTLFVRILHRAIGRNDQMALATVEALKRWMPRSQVFRQRAFKDAEDGLMTLQTCNQFSLLEAFLRPNLSFAIDSANIVLDRISNAEQLGFGDRLSIKLNSEERSNRRVPLISAETQKQISLAGMLKIEIPAKEAFATHVSIMFDPQLKDVEPYLITEGSTLKSQKSATLMFDLIPYGKLRIVLENSKGKREFIVIHKDENTSLNVSSCVGLEWKKNDTNVCLEIMPRISSPAWVRMLFGWPQLGEFDGAEITKQNVIKANLELTIGGQKVALKSPDNFVQFEYDSQIPTGDIVLSDGQNRITIGSISRYRCQVFTEFEMLSGLSATLNEDYEIWALEVENYGPGFSFLERDKNIKAGVPGFDPSIVVIPRKIMGRCFGVGRASTLRNALKKLRNQRDKFDLDDDMNSVSVDVPENYDTMYVGIGGMSPLEELLSRRNNAHLSQTSESVLDDYVDIFSTRRSSPRKTPMQDGNKKNIEASKSELLSLIDIVEGGYLDTMGGVSINNAYIEKAVIKDQQYGDTDDDINGLKDDKPKSGLGLLINGSQVRIFIKSQEQNDAPGPVKLSVKDMIRGSIKSQSTRWSVTKY